MYLEGNIYDDGKNCSCIGGFFDLCASIKLFAAVPEVWLKKAFHLSSWDYKPPASVDT